MIHHVLDSTLCVGDAISARNLKTIYEHEFAAVVDLALNEPPAVLGRDVIYCRFPLSDDDSNRDEVVAAAIVCLCGLIRQRLKVLVACSAGMSRSPVIAAASIAMTTGDELGETLLRVVAQGPHDVSATFLTSVERVCAKLTTADQHH